MMTSTRTNKTEVSDANFDLEEMRMLQRCAQKISGHLDRNISTSSNQRQINRLLSAKWFIDENYL